MDVKEQLQEMINNLEFILVDCQGVEFEDPKIDSFVTGALGKVELAISDLESAIEESV